LEGKKPAGGFKPGTQGLEKAEASIHGGDAAKGQDDALGRASECFLKDEA
jgi:hypothetical protein